MTMSGIEVTRGGVFQAHSSKEYSFKVRGNTREGGLPIEFVSRVYIEKQL